MIRETSAEGGGEVAARRGTRPQTQPALLFLPPQGTTLAEFGGFLFTEWR